MRVDLSRDDGVTWLRERSSLLERAVEQERNSFEKARLVERFLEKGFALPQRACIHHQIDVPGYVEDLEVWSSRSNAADHFVTRQLGHVQVCNQQIQWSSVREQLDGFGATAGLGHVVAAGLQRASLDLPDRGFVVDDEYGRQRLLFAHCQFIHHSTSLRPLPGEVNERFEANLGTIDTNSSTRRVFFQPLPASTRNSPHACSDVTAVLCGRSVVSAS